MWMRRLPADRMLDRLVETGRPIIGCWRTSAAPSPSSTRRAATGPSIAHFGREEAIRRNLAENLARTGRFPAGGAAPGHAHDRGRLPAPRRCATSGGASPSAVRAGRVRDCHGDLQAQHVCCTDPVQVFDCIEFNHRFRYGDTAGEIAFLAMDLDARGRPDLALDFVNAYLDVERRLRRGAAARLLSRVPGVDPRQGVRSAGGRSGSRRSRGARGTRARSYFDLAASYARPRGTPALTVMTGLSASGKSTVAREIAHGAAAIVVRTDAVRKQLAGVPVASAPHGGSR